MQSGLPKLPGGGVTLLACRSMFRMARRGTTCQWLLLMLLCTAVISCAGLTTTYKGTLANPDNRHPLNTTDGGPAAWQAKDMALYYESIVRNGDLVINGTVERLNTVKHYNGINYFRVSIHFLDGEGVILGSHLIWSAGSRVDEKLVRWTFEKQIPMPVGTTAVGFSYRGGFSDGGSGDSGSVQSGWEIWARP